LIADDFSAELAEGLAYVAGHDDESRPVLVNFHFIVTLYFSKNIIMYCTILFFSELKVCDFEFDFVVYRFSA
jgi:hypothetical protein